MGCIECSETQRCSRHHPEDFSASDSLNRGQLGEGDVKAFRSNSLTIPRCAEPTIEEESPSNESSTESSNTWRRSTKEEPVYNSNNGTLDSRIILSFLHGDPENPVNWSSVRVAHTFVLYTLLTQLQRKKAVVMLMGIINSTLGSSLPSGAMSYIGPYFQVTDQAQLVLPISLFLAGYVLGPLAFGPLSESYGRRVIMVSSFVFFTIFTMGQ